MGERSAIEWTDATWTPIRARNLGTGKAGWHCEHASEGCRNCYAEGMNRRLGTQLEFKPGHRKDVEIFLDEKMLLEPLRWKRPRTIFVCSMTDLFADFVPDEMIDRMFAVMALCPQHRFQVLTKRSPRMRAYSNDPATPRRIAAIILRHAMDWLGGFQRAFAALVDRAKDSDPETITWPLPNVWKGVSVEDQTRADERIPDLLATPATVRFLSCEPLLGPVALNRVCLGEGDVDQTQPHAEGLKTIRFNINALAGVQSFKWPALDWVIAGGESGPRARPMHPDWARSLRDQCAEAGVPFFFKQWGEWGPDTGPDDDRDRDGYQRDRVMEGAGPCAVLVDGSWQSFDSGYAVPIELCSGRRGCVYRLGKKRNGRLLDGVEHSGMPV